MVVLALLDVGKVGKGQEDDGEVVEMVWMSGHEQGEEKVGDKVDKDNTTSFL